MRLQSIRIKNFRSITKASRMELSDSTILVGPNNEGKSNVLRALVLSMNLLLGKRSRHRAPRRGTVADGYNWERDFPVPLQARQPKGESEFVLEFSLSEQEEAEFFDSVGSRVKDRLPISVRVGAYGASKIAFFKTGRGAKKLRSKIADIGEFIKARFALEYIPAIRTAGSAQQVVGELLSRELSALEQGEEFQAALAKIGELQQPVLDELSRSISSTLQQFLPALQAVEVAVPPERRYAALRGAEIYIDDGTKTELRFKGDGVQSLAVLALMRHASHQRREGKGVLVAIEEPESHLHPAAIHELYDVIRQLATEQQVVLTTHCPLFVDREEVSSNVIVEGGRARPAKNVAEVRGILGVRASDNLQHAELVLVVEGEDDRNALTALLRDASPALSRAFTRHRLAIDALGGASNLTYKLGLIRDALCSAYCFLDDDKAGREAIGKAKDARLLGDADFSMTVCRGHGESEFEDLLSPALVERVLGARFGVMTTRVPATEQRRKWSDRMAFVFQAAGKPWNKAVQMALKASVTEEVVRAPGAALAAGRKSVFDNLVAVLEARLAKKSA